MLRALAPRPYVPVLYWDQVVDKPTLDEAVEVVARAYNFRRHPYFEWMQDPATTRTSFRCSQARFRFAVEGWSQSLAAVLARMPRMEARRGLAKNVQDEHGEDGDHSHKASFGRYLAALGCTPEELATPCPIEVRAFSQALTNFCLVHHHEAGAAALGIIEYVYITISNMIVGTLAERRWVEPGSQDHYDVHETLDVEHARDLFEVAKPGWHEGRIRSDVALGLQLGAHHFWALYDDLLPGP